MATVQGKSYWASITRPNTTFDPVYQIDLAVDDDVAKDFSGKGITVKEDERGKIDKYKLRVSRADGTNNPAPKLVDASKNPIDVLVGNGSTVKVMYKEYDWNYAGKTGVGLDLQAVQVIDLFPYGEEFDKVDGFVSTDSVDEF